MTRPNRQSDLQRWWPSVSMLFCSLLSYIDRQTLAVLSLTILAELKLSTFSYTKIVAWFSIAYMIANPFWGVVLDRIGLKRGMAIAVGLWSIAIGLHSLTTGVVGLCVLRALLGFGEGATFPGGLKAATDSLPPDNQGRGIAIAYGGASLGAVVTPLLMIPLAHVLGWRAAFILMSVVGAVWIFLWLTTVRLPASADATIGRLTFPNPLEVRFWRLVSTYSLGGLPLAPILYLAPLYLARKHGFSQDNLAHVLWIPPLGWEAGYFFWGWFYDRYLSRNQSPARLYIALAILGIPVASITHLPGPSSVLAVMFWTMFVAAGFVIVSLRSAGMAYPRAQTGLVAGVGAGAWSAIVFFILPVFGRMFDAGNYSRVFLIIGLTPILGTAIWLLLGTRRNVPAAAISPRET